MLFIVVGLVNFPSYVESCNIKAPYPRRVCDDCHGKIKQLVAKFRARIQPSLEDMILYILPSFCGCRCSCCCWNIAGP